MEKDPLTIELNANTKSIIKFGFAFTGFVVLICVFGFFFMAFTIIKDITVLAVVLMVAGVLLFYVAKKYFQNVFYKEIIIVDRSKLTILNKSFSSEKKYEFELKDIKYFGHVGIQEYTEHPMNNSIVDFTGLGTSERELQFLIDDGTIEIVTEDHALRFGKNIPSWTTEEVIEKIESYIGRKFAIKPQEEIAGEDENSEDREL